MRIIPKKTKVAMEFFKGVEIPDVLVGILGISIVMSIFFSNLPGRLWLGAGIGILFGASVIPVEGEKAYMMVFNTLKYLARYKRFGESQGKKENPLGPGHYSFYRGGRQFY